MVFLNFKINMRNTAYFNFQKMLFQSYLSPAAYYLVIHEIRVTPHLFWS